MRACAQPNCFDVLYHLIWPLFERFKGEIDFPIHTHNSRAIALTKRERGGAILFAHRHGAEQQAPANKRRKRETGEVVERKKKLYIFTFSFSQPLL